MSVVSVTVSQVLVGQSVAVTPVVSETITIRQVEAGAPGPGGLGPETSTIVASEALAAGVSESAMLGIAVDATTKARAPRRYLRGGIERLTADAGARPAAVGPNPLANIAADVPVPPLPAPETTAAGLAAARAALKRTPA